MGSADDCFSLKWSDFWSNLSDGFHDLLEEKMMVDVTLAAEGKFVQAHKLVLSVCSPYFKNLFKVNPCKHPIVILKDVGHNELSYMLQFMYRGEVGVKHDDLPSFFKLADTLKVKGLAGEEIEESKKNNFSEKSNSTTIKVRKKRSSNLTEDCDKKSSEFRCSPNKLKGKKFSEIRKRRLSTKSEAVKNIIKSKKVKKTHLVSDSVIVSGESSSDNDQDNNPLARLMADKVKSDRNSDFGESDSELKNDFSGEKSELNVNEEEDVECGGNEEDDVEDEENDYPGDEDDFEVSASHFVPDHTSETDQTPQDLDQRFKVSVPRRTKNVRTSLIWRYFIKYPASATCRLCGRTFKGFRPHTSIECHLKTRHHCQYLDFMKSREEQRKQLAKDQFAHLFPRFYGMNNYNYQ